MTPPAIGEKVRLNRDFITSRLGKYAVGVNREIGVVVDVLLVQAVPQVVVAWGISRVPVAVKWLEKVG